MSNQEWDALATQWESQEVGDPALLQRRVNRHLRLNRLGLLGEALSLLGALALVTVAWTRAPELRDWLVAAVVVLLLGQTVYLVLRHRYRLFGSPNGGLVGLIDAEIRRARFVIATYCIGMLLVALLFVLVWLLIPAEHHSSIGLGIALGSGLTLIYTIPRAVLLLRLIRRLQSERADLSG